MIPMQDIEPLIFDLVEWVAKAPRSHTDVMNTWRTSCPRLTVWEDAVDRGLLVRKNSPDGAIVEVTARGRKFLASRTQRSTTAIGSGAAPSTRSG
jgi:hypothetical protein